MTHHFDCFKASIYAPRIKPLVGAALTALALAGAATAQAAPTGAVIDFESATPGPILSYDPNSGPTPDDVFTSNGFYISAFTNSQLGQAGDLVGAVVDGSDVASTCWNMACPTSASNSSKYLTSLNDGVIDIFHTTGQGFQLKSFDASFLGNYDGGTFPAVSGILRIQGITATGYLTQDFRLDGPDANGFEFGHFTTTGAFSTTNFTELYIFGFACESNGSCSAFSTDRAQFAIDNIATTAPVPEPATWMMMGAGLLGLAATRRRKA